MINRVILAGRLTRDPEVRTTTTGKKVADFSIAVQKRMKPQDGSSDADFFRVSCWGATAEFVGNYVTKGRLVIIEGRLQSRKFVDKQGNNREVVEVVADSVNPLERPRDGENQRDNSGQGESEVAVPSGTVDEEYDPFADE